MKRAIKRAAIWMYCRNLLTARATAYVFNKINLRSE
jgi:hypothetical protein